jgi:hypothetical protein
MARKIRHSLNWEIGKDLVSVQKRYRKLAKEFDYMPRNLLLAKGDLDDVPTQLRQRNYADAKLSLASAETALNHLDGVNRKHADVHDIIMLDRDKIASVYSGKAGRCCCGCAGKHFTASQHRSWEGRNRGYKVRDEEVSDRMVKKVWGILVSNAEIATPIKAGPISTYTSVTIGNRLYIAYLRTKDEKKRRK